MITALWELPFGKNGNRIYKAIVGGWQLNGIMTFQSGLPIPLQITGQTLALRPNVVPGVSDRISNQSLSQWFNTSAFSAPAPFTYGNVARTLPDISGDRQEPGLLVIQEFYGPREIQVPVPGRGFQPDQHADLREPGHYFRTPTFGQVTATAFFPQPRVVQFGLKMQF